MQASISMSRLQGLCSDAGGVEQGDRLSLPAGWPPGFILNPPGWPTQTQTEPTLPSWPPET